MSGAGPAKEPSPPPAWLVRLNVALLRRGLGVGSQHLLSLPGRTTGITRSTPVSVAWVGGERYIVAAFATANWVLNARVAGEGVLSRRRKDELVGLVELPVDARPPVLRAFLEQVPRGVRFFGGRGAEEAARSAERYPVFHIVPKKG